MNLEKRVRQSITEFGMNMAIAFVSMVVPISPVYANVSPTPLTVICEPKEENLYRQYIVIPDNAPKEMKIVREYYDKSTGGFCSVSYFVESAVQGIDKYVVNFEKLGVKQ